MKNLSTPAVLQTRRNLIMAGSQILTAMALGLPLSGCQDNAQLGRSQLILIGDDELERMSLQTELDIRRRIGVSQDYNRQRRLERIAANMADVPGAPRPRRGFRAQLLASNDVNAFVLPNGYHQLLYRIR
jgi:predicted Zn-dependent protease